MESVKTNYIKNTNPELREQFVEILRQIPHFSGLSNDLLDMLFQYAKFVPLQDGERPVLEGMFGQEIYTLIRGKLERFIKGEAESEKQVDVIYKPFSLFGEQCILGEMNNASIEARDEALLLGIDISALPDMIDAMENPEGRLEDSAYQQNTALYTVFATVLTERLDRLIKDKYKLVQRISILHDSDAYRAVWQQNSLLTTIYNEFGNNELAPELGIQPILQRQLKPLFEHSQALQALLASETIDTQKIYVELIRMKALGAPVHMNELLLEITQEISENAWQHDEYRQNRLFEPYDASSYDCLADFLNEAYDAIVESGVLAQPMEKAQFLAAFLSDNGLSPTSLIDWLRAENLVNDEFSLACCLYLICQTCISKELMVNHGIARAIAYLLSVSTPRQFIQLSQVPNLQLVQEVEQLYQVDDDAGTVEEEPKKAAHQESVEDLLSEFGL